MKRPLKNLSFAAVLCVVSAPVVAQQRREYALVLADPPIAQTVSSRKELGGKAAVDAGARIEQAQQTLRRQLSERRVAVVGSVKTVLNAVFVITDDPRKLEGLAGVQRVARTRVFRRHLNAALPLVNAQQAWTALAGAGFANAGAGVKIGVIDTGIDQTHPAFQDSSLSAPAGYPKCQPADCAYTNSKVIVARSYMAMQTGGGAGISRPDDLTPRDRVGHGTAAAMIAAGAQNAGPLATISGIAPKAFLGNYKIFGSPGVNDGASGAALIQALDDAYNDGMNIVSVAMGLTAWYSWQDKGAACGESDPNAACDVEAAAAENAMAHNGLVVVVSAGDDGGLGVQPPALNSIHTPGTAPSVVTVGSSRNGHMMWSKVGLAAADAPSNLRNISALFGDWPRPKVTAPLRDVTQLGDDGFACAALPAGSLSGAIALVQRNEALCDFITKARNAQNAGAAGMLIYREAGVETPLRPIVLASSAIPVAGIGNNDGRALKTHLQTHPDAQMTLDPALTASDDSARDTVAAYSSRGPSIDFLIKPELVAPGTALYTATQKYDSNGELYDPSGYTVADGTSMAAPLVAGAIALVKQKNPNFTAAQLKSAVVNTASASVLDGGAPATLAAAGAGKLNAEAAIRTNVTVDPATLSFGVITPAALGGSRALTVYNGSGSAVTLAIAQTTPDSNAHLRLSKTSVAAGQTDTVAVYIEGSQPAPGAYEGAITITGGAVNLRAPYSYVVGDGVPYNVFAVSNNDFLGVAGQRIPGYSVGLKAVDRFGVPTAGAAATWRGSKGGASIDAADPQTDKYGLAFAAVFLGATAGDQEITGSVGTQPLQFPFRGTARLQPAISAGGVIDAASGQAAVSGRGLAPGSYISIWGQNLSDTMMSWDALFPTGVPLHLPVSLAGVSVSFDAPNVSVPGRLTWVGPNQINVQIPWELAGASSAQVKVRIREITTAVYTLYLSDHAPGVFEAPLGSGLAAATDALTGTLITTANPAQKNRWVSIYVNGLGPVNNRPPTGEATPAQPLAQCIETPVVTIGGRPAAVNFAGLTPTGVGYYQINALVPADAPSGNQPVTVTAHDVAAKAVNLPVQ